mmetsp:Transcript_41285/g.80803  ORF Transcript_41285/g.80803 Transcript_41285/m.80803 type:complete len:174 (+) Transcript_41285:66-587(+)
MAVRTRTVVAAIAIYIAVACRQTHSFSTSAPFGISERSVQNSRVAPSSSRDALASSLRMSDELEPLGNTQARIKSIVDTNSVVLFMKGSKLFPQCGFSNTATQILNSYGINFESVDVLSDEAIRAGIKEYSQWPTIPQLYVAGEFIGGSDIMIEMYQSGELGEMIEKAKADMM